MAKFGTITKSKILPLRAPYGFDFGRYLPPLRMTRRLNRNLLAEDDCVEAGGDEPLPYSEKMHPHNCEVHKKFREGAGENFSQKGFSPIFRP